MVSVDKAVVARLKTHGTNFEILVDCDLALKFKEQGNVPLEEILASEKIFIEQSKGTFASEAALAKAFNTTNHLAIAQEILRRGEIHLTSEYRAKLREAKRRNILETIHRNAVDPTSGLPHPVKRLELAFEQAKITIDENQPAEKQVERIVEKLQPILPIKFDRKQIEIRLPGPTAEKVYNAVLRLGTKIKVEWKGDGSCLMILEIPAGLQGEFFEKLNALTHGNNDARILNERK